MELLVCMWLVIDVTVSGPLERDRVGGTGAAGQIRGSGNHPLGQGGRFVKGSQVYVKTHTHHPETSTAQNQGLSSPGATGSKQEDSGDTPRMQPSALQAW
ncbi:unnamed protein product [Arctogadus glacialis]